MDELLRLDKSVFMLLNGWGNTGADQLMLMISKTTTWIPLHLLIIYLLFKRYAQKSIWIVLIIVCAVAVSDQLSSSVIKPAVARLRPSHDPELANQVRLVNDYRGGMYGFVSSHASNTFAVAFIVSLLLPQRWLVVVLFTWAALVSYSRIYLGVHYPFDIIGGALLGIALGGVAFWLIQKFLHVKR